MRPSTRKRGYSLVMVLLFLTLYLGLWGMAARQIATMLRIEQARARRASRDADAQMAMYALAKGLAALEVGYPPSKSYTVNAKVSSPDYTLTFTASDSDSSWTVQVAPASDPSLPILDPKQFIAQHP